jgi:hypothetical protein
VPSFVRSVRPTGRKLLSSDALRFAPHTLRGIVPKHLYLGFLSVTPDRVMPGTS